MSISNLIVDLSFHLLIFFILLSLSKKLLCCNYYASLLVAQKKIAFLEFIYLKQMKKERGKIWRRKTRWKEIKKRKNRCIKNLLPGRIYTVHICIICLISFEIHNPHQNPTKCILLFPFYIWETMFREVT